MKNILGIFLLIVIGLMLLPVVTTSVSEYDILTTSEDFTVIQDATIAEVITVSETPEEIKAVYVNGVVTTEYTAVAGVLTFTIDATVTDDVVTVTYTYQEAMSGSVDTIIQILPLIFVLILVGGAVVYLKFKN